MEAQGPSRAQPPLSIATDQSLNTSMKQNIGSQRRPPLLNDRPPPGLANASHDAESSRASPIDTHLRQRQASLTLSSGDHADMDSTSSSARMSRRLEAQEISQHVEEIEMGYSDDENKTTPRRSERTFNQRRDLGLLDVAALIINKMVGTGIFTTPGLVLGLTQSKSISLGMWVIGGLWSFLSVTIYVELGSAFPFNGGELIYLDEVFRRPELFATALFSAFFIFVPQTDGNSIQFARHVLLAAQSDVTSTNDLDWRLITYVAISILTVICLINYWSRPSGLFLNRIFAAFKITFLIVLIVAGGLARNNWQGSDNWGVSNAPPENYIAAMVFIIYSYQGWENANYVGGELDVPRTALKLGAFLAVGIVTVLYCLATMIFQLVCTSQELEGTGTDLAIALTWAPRVFGPNHIAGVKICIALSAVGNLVAVVYATSKVKQQIARQRILPFWRFFAANAPPFMTPAGALILHWVFAATWIICTPNTSAGYGFVISLFIYGQLLIGVAVAMAFFWIKSTYEAPDARSQIASAVWRPVILKNKFARVVSGSLFAGINLLVLVEGARGSSDPPNWVRPVTIFSVLCFAAALWGILRLIAWRSRPGSALEIRIVRDGMGPFYALDQAELDEAKREHNSRVIIYETSGRLQRILQMIERWLHWFGGLITR